MSASREGTGPRRNRRVLTGLVRRFLNRRSQRSAVKEEQEALLKLLLQFPRPDQLSTTLTWSSGRPNGPDRLARSPPTGRPRPLPLPYSKTAGPIHDLNQAEGQGALPR